MYIGNGTSADYMMPIAMVEDSNLTSDDVFAKMRPIIMHHAVGSSFEQLCRSIVNPATRDNSDYGSTECILMESWKLPEMTHLVGASNRITSGSGVTSGFAKFPYTIYYNQAYPTPPEHYRTSAKTVSPGSGYHLLTYDFTTDAGWGVSNQWTLLDSGSYGTRPLAMRIDMKSLLSLVKTKFPSDTVVYIALDFIGIITKGDGDSKLATSSGMQVLMTERQTYTQGGTLENSLAFGDSSLTSYNVGGGDITRTAPTQTGRCMFTLHGLLKSVTVGGSSDNSTASVWELDFTPILPTHIESTVQGAAYGIKRPSIRVSICCKRP